MPNKTEDLQKSINDLGNAFENFKAANDERLQQLEERGHEDPILKETVEKWNDRLDQVELLKETVEKDIQRSLEDATRRMDGLETRMNRPGAGSGKTPEKRTDSPAFTKYLRKGHSAEIGEKARQEVGELWKEYLGVDSVDQFEKAMSVISDPDGGYMVTPSRANSIITRIFDRTPIRDLATIISIGTDSYEELVDDDDIASGGWVGETQTRSETATPQTGMLKVPVHEQYAEPRTSQKNVDDSMFDIESWLNNKIADKFSREESTAFVSGSGEGKPKGFLSYDDGVAWNKVEQIESNASGAVDGDDFIEVFYALQAEYAGRATWMLNRQIIKHARKLKDGNGQYIWEPGLATNVPNTLVGATYREATDMDNAVSAGNKVAVIADWREFYLIVDRMDIRVLRDPYTAKPWIKFYTTKRVGGSVRQGRAGKILKVAA